METDDARKVLATWRERLLTNDQVATWASDQLDALGRSIYPDPTR